MDFAGALELLRVVRGDEASNEIDGKDEGMVGERCQHGISSFGISVVQVL